MNYKILIIENELLVARDLELILTKYGHRTLGIAQDYNETNRLLKRTQPDLLLIDIHLGSGKSGIEIAKVVKEKHRLPFVFITSFSDTNTIENAKKLGPIGYLVQPFNKKNVVMTIEIGMTNWLSRIPRPKPRLYDRIVQQDFFFIKDRGMMKKISFDDIYSLEADDNYTFIHTRGKARYIVYISLKELLKKLPNQFVRVHKSHIANIDYIEGLKTNKIFLPENKSLPVGRTFKLSLIERLNFLGPNG